MICTRYTVVRCESVVSCSRPRGALSDELREWTGSSRASDALAVRTDPSQSSG